MMRTPLEGANSIIYAAVNPDLKGVSGIYFKDCRDGYTTPASRYFFKGKKIFGTYLSLVTRKPVFGVFDQVRLKPACAAKETR